MLTLNSDDTFGWGEIFKFFNWFIVVFIGEGVQLWLLSRGSLFNCAWRLLCTSGVLIFLGAIGEDEYGGGNFRLIWFNAEIFNAGKSFFELGLDWSFDNWFLGVVYIGVILFLIGEFIFWLVKVVPVGGTVLVEEYEACEELKLPLLLSCDDGVKLFVLIGFIVFCFEEFIWIWFISNGDSIPFVDTLFLDNGDAIGLFVGTNGLIGNKIGLFGGGNGLTLGFGPMGIFGLFCKFGFWGIFGIAGLKFIKFGGGLLYIILGGIGVMFLPKGDDTKLEPALESWLLELILLLLISDVVEFGLELFEEG